MNTCPQYLCKCGSIYPESEWRIICQVCAANTARETPPPAPHVKPIYDAEYVAAISETPSEPAANAYDNNGNPIALSVSNGEPDIEAIARLTEKLSPSQLQQLADRLAIIRESAAERKTLGEGHVQRAKECAKQKADEAKDALATERREIMSRPPGHHLHGSIAAQHVRIGWDAALKFVRGKK